MAKRFSKARQTSAFMPLPQASRSRWRTLGRMRRRRGEIAAEFADILEQRAIPARNVVPELARRKAFLHDDRAAADQRRAGRHDAADAVIERQAIVHAIVRPDVGEAGEPIAPHHDAVMADMGRLRQAGRAGGVDQQRAIGAGARRVSRRRPVRRRRAHRPRGRCAAAAEPGFAVQPDFRRRGEMGRRASRKIAPARPRR